MIFNYFKIALRNLRAGGWYSALNIGGLAIVLSVSILLFWWVKDELSFDRFHPHADRTYLVHSHFGKGDDENTFTSTPTPVALAARSIPEIEAATRTGPFPGVTFRVGSKTFTEKQHIAFADTNFLAVFAGFKVIEGDPKKPFPAPNAALISEKLAEKFFGTTDVIGRTIRNIETKTDLTISAVLANAPDNASLQNDLYISMHVRKTIDQKLGGHQLMDEDWDDFGIETYIRLKETANAKTIDRKLTASHAVAVAQKIQSDYLLQPLTQAHLHPLEGDDSAARQVNMLGIVAVLLLSIGCINYVNLTTARATRRYKEIGVRKVVGAGAGQLASQLLVESVLTLSLSLILAVAFLQALLPHYASFTGKSGHFSLLDPSAWQVLAGTLGFCFLMAGIYPALMVSRFNPIQALRARSGHAGAARLRKSLVVVQFALAVALIAGTFVIGSQLRFIRERDAGFERKHTYTFDGRHLTQQFKQALAGQASITGISTSTDTPVNVQTGSASFDWDGKPADRTLVMAQMSVDKDFIPNFRIKLVAGRNFHGNKSDQRHFILNETAIRQTGIKDPIGKRFKADGGEGIIIGVVKDFNMMSVREEMWPLVMYSNPESHNMVNVHTTAALAPAALAATEKRWKAYLPDYPFSYTFIDTAYDQLYRTEQLTGQLFNFFAAVAIIISCLGLFGLASFVTEQRTKEIGIRKVLGATITNITVLLSRDFVKLILIAILIASPVSWFLMDQWLNDFAYRVEINGWLFAFAGLLALVTALLTVSFQSIKVASVNPTKTMKAE
ncbi:ABC-type antimicrobial peptide transport system, permease component [Dyadobacter soli]|uniref:ABC-type antimicrobial peptide transport system, permease component n=1 Tax=Dyadobacter soli TaxID=659014 RepID=A0A1G7GIK0_9BACT|nr:ABC transporter permease [Dyadobacter soli]SDE87982.1 ABC-type antimicrobial peptide transport system, permease component [Dyadobacter soli]